jgi:hypothetical protein
MNQRFSVSRVCDEYEAQYPELVSFLRKRIKEELIEESFRYMTSEINLTLEEGKIIIFSKVHETQNPSLDAVTFRQDVFITDLVHCKYCKHNTAQTCDLFNIRVKDCFFCALGEKKDV